MADPLHQHLSISINSIKLVCVPFSPSMTMISESVNSPPHTSRWKPPAYHHQQSQQTDKHTNRQTVASIHSDLILKPYHFQIHRR